jgi:hypothetical protein
LSAQPKNNFAMTEMAPPFKSPLSHEALRQIHAVTGKLMRFKEGEEVNAATMQSLVGELLLNMRVIQYNMASSEHSSLFTAVMPLAAKKAKAERLRAQFWAVALELFNEVGGVLFLFKLAALPRLFYTSLTFLRSTATRLKGRNPVPKVLRK